MFESLKEMFMKKILIYSSLLCGLFNAAQAQTLFNNGGFETWTN